MTSSQQTPPALHPQLAPLAFLLGTWHGEGRGEYPTIASFGYREETTFSHNGKPFLVYQQRTWALDDGRPLHVEHGYWRAPSTSALEVVIIQPTGISEGLVGTVHDQRVTLTSASVTTTTTAKPVEAVARRWWIDDQGALRYEVDMAAVGLTLRHHLSATLRPAA